MARKPNYEHLSIVDREPEPPELPAPARGSDSELLKDIAQGFVVYLHPDAHKTLLRYALEQSSFKAKVRPHDLIIEAIEAFFEARGLPGPVRAKPVRGKGRGGVA